MVLISIDGWRWDYLDQFAPPTLSRLASTGVRAEGLVPVFPSKTFPNHYSIVTGLYPDHHGIISNNMLDPSLPGRFGLNAREVMADTRWWGGEPLWVTVERQGQRAATMFWPGSDVEIAGDRPTFWKPFDNDLPDAARVDQVLQWLDEPEGRRPTFLTLYFGSVDHFGHEDGPAAEVTRAAALAVDAAIARLLTGIERAGVADRTNLILVSDHGMAELARERTIVLDDYFDVSSADIIDTSPIVALNPRTTTTAALYSALHGKHPALRVFTKETLPTDYRLRNHPRLPAVIGIADDGWHITTREALQRNDGEVPAGTHGYDPKYQSMHGLFVASGPHFRRGVVVPAFENVHIYELICQLLGLRPAPNDGRASATAGFLRH
ncbi:MAG TPA: ectonucleotide pyrophosphatase/phosphodiesterase [Vicinamibacterales bacterium]|nr:ectonucleotide pyrophosphatase/phosphodiesterase [Vicinamibacterales bacterium]